MCSPDRGTCESAAQKRWFHGTGLDWATWHSIHALLLYNAPACNATGTSDNLRKRLFDIHLSALLEIACYGLSFEVS